MKLKLENVLHLCKKHGFTVGRNNDWLWLNSTDGRYSEDEEYKILRDIGLDTRIIKVNSIVYARKLIHMKDTNQLLMLIIGKIITKF